MKDQNFDDVRVVPTPNEMHDIKKDFSLYLSLWGLGYNHELYSEELFSQFLFSSLHGKYSSLKDDKPKSILTQRNDHYYSESKTMEQDLLGVRKIVSKYNFDLDYPTNLRRFRINFENTSEGENARNFLSQLKGNLDYENSENFVETKLKESTPDQILYYCIVVYIDFCKNYAFFLSKVDASLPITPRVTSRFGFKFVRQAALYHCVLVNSNKQPRIQEVEKECEDLAIKYGFNSGKKFSVFYNRIDNNKGNTSCTKKDAELVRKVLKEYHPDHSKLIMKLEEITGPLYPD